MIDSGRRTLLRTLALLGTTGLAGCSGLFASSTDGPDEPTSTSRTPTETPTATLTRTSAGTSSSTATPTGTPTDSSTPTATPTATSVSTVTEAASLTAADERDQFGRSVAVDGSTALVGAPWDGDPNGSQAGAVYVFERDGTGWSQTTRLAAADGQSEDNFGSTVALSGATAFVGATGAGENGRGATYVFERRDGQWNQRTKFAPESLDSEDQFGGALALDGDRALVGTVSRRVPLGDADEVGPVYAFSRDGDGWHRDGELTPPDRAWDFGYAVALSGTTAVVGAPLAETADGAAAGSAHVFDADGGWRHRTTLTPESADSGDLFGTAVAVAGDTAVVGAARDDDPYGYESNALGGGSAYAFERSGGEWQETAKLAASDGDVEDRFGSAVALSADRLLVAADADEDPHGVEAGSVYLFERAGEEWTQRAKLVAGAGTRGQGFGHALACDDDTALVGTRAPTDGTPPTAYVFDL